MYAVIRSRASRYRERGRDLHVTGRLQSVSAKSSEVGSLPLCHPLVLGGASGGKPVVKALH